MRNNKKSDATGRIINGMYARMRRLRAAGNHEGQKHLVAFAAEAVGGSGNAAQRRRARRQARQWAVANVRRLVAEMAA